MGVCRHSSAHGLALHVVQALPGLLAGSGCTTGAPQQQRLEIVITAARTWTPCTRSTLADFRMPDSKQPRCNGSASARAVRRPNAARTARGGPWVVDEQRERGYTPPLPPSIDGANAIRGTAAGRTSQTVCSKNWSTRCAVARPEITRLGGAPPETGGPRDSKRRASCCSMRMGGGSRQPNDNPSSFTIPRAGRHSAKSAASVCARGWASAHPEAGAADHSV